MSSTNSITLIIWNGQRTLKKSITCDGKLHVVLEQGCKKLNMKPVGGLTLVLEKNGTEVDDDLTMHHFASSNSIFQLLNPGEQWASVITEDPYLNLERRRLDQEDRRLNQKELEVKENLAMEKEKLRLQMEAHKESLKMVKIGAGFCIVGAAFIAAPVAVPLAVAGAAGVAVGGSTITLGAIKHTRTTPTQ